MIDLRQGLRFDDYLRTPIGEVHDHYVVTTRPSRPKANLLWQAADVPLEGTQFLEWRGRIRPSFEFGERRKRDSYAPVRPGAEVKWFTSSYLKRVDHAGARREHVDFNDSFALTKGRARRRPGIRVLLGEEILPVEIGKHFFRPLIGKTQKTVES